MQISFKKYIAPIVIGVVLLLNLMLGLARLGTYSAVDEPYWTYGRISKFWTAIEQQKWRSTNINDKPGITVAILSGFGLLKFDPMTYQSLRGDTKTTQELSDINAINFYFRLPIFLFCLFSLPLFYVFLKKLFDETVALIGFLLIALSPILLGISMIINPDSILWIFLPLALLSYLVYQEGDDERYLHLAGIFIGLSLLTKYVSNVLYIFLFLLPFLQYILAEKKPDLRVYLKKFLKDYLILVFLSMAVFYILYPATWTHPDTLLKGTFLSKAFETTWPAFALLIGLILADIFLFKNKVLGFILGKISLFKNWIVYGVIGIFLFLIAFVFVDTYFGMKPFDLVGTLSSPKGIGSESILPRYTGAILADVFSLLFGLSPIALLGLLAGLFFTVRKNILKTKEIKIILFFVLFILLYYLGSTVNNVAATVRYQIALYPLAFIISAIGLRALLSLSQTYVRERMKKNWSLTLGFFGILIIILVSSVLMIRPFYFSYASALLPEKYLLNSKDMGDGSYEIAMYLNTLPNARELAIWSDKGAVCAEFIGKCTIGLTKKDLEGKTFNYYVISMGRVNRSLKMSGGVNDIVDFKKIYSTKTFEKNIIMGGRPGNFVRIISAESLK